jgi:hypothetical protein
MRAQKQACPLLPGGTLPKSQVKSWPLWLGLGLPPMKVKTGCRVSQSTMGSAAEESLLQLRQ